MDSCCDADNAFKVAVCGRGISMGEARIQSGAAPARLRARPDAGGAFAPRHADVRRQRHRVRAASDQPRVHRRDSLDFVGLDRARIAQAPRRSGELIETVSTAEKRQ